MIALKFGICVVLNRKLIKLIISSYIEFVDRITEMSRHVTKTSSTEFALEFETLPAFQFKWLFTVLFL